MALRRDIILGIETSCDDTAAAVLTEGRLASSVVSSQTEHDRFGGVVPELASRSHERAIIPIVEAALSEAGVDKGDLGAIAVTHGPGLAGSLLVGLSFAKGLAAALDIPVVGVNHLEGHLYSLHLTDPAPETPYLCLIVSGGHTQLMRVDRGFEHRLLGRTRDDAAGEAFDKVAKMLGLGYPGGPDIDRLARRGDPAFHRFPRTRLQGYDMSFSGIKTSMLYYLNEFDEDERRAHLQSHLPDLCASFQEAVIDMLVDPMRRAATDTGIRTLAVAGGVSANSALRERFDTLADETGAAVHFPEAAFRTDNAAMIAAAGRAAILAGRTSPLTLTVNPSLSFSSHG